MAMLNPQLGGYPNIDIDRVASVANGGSNNFTPISMSPVQNYTSPNIPISTGTGGPGWGGLASSGGAVAGAIIGSVVPVIGTALGSVVGAGLGALGGGIIDWIMAEDAADKQQAETERINREMARQRGEEIARTERWRSQDVAYRNRAQRDQELMNSWTMKNTDSDRRLQRGFLFANTLSGMMNANDEYRTRLINLRRGAA